MKPAVCVQNVSKRYEMDGGTVNALSGVTLEVPQGDFVSVMGSSGSGKSTLLNLLGCLDRPTSGNIIFDGEDITQLSDNRLSEIRATRIGFIFQSYNLIPQLTVLENIEVPLFYAGGVGSKMRKRSKELAAMVGLADRLKHRPTQLSGGQQQRVAIARSLVNDPYFLLADEPTGNLDSATSEEILDLLIELNKQGKTIILVTHEQEVGNRTKRIVRLRDGEVESDRELGVRGKVQ